ncbi:MAG: SLC13 family permease [Anaerolineales bacterium]
MNHEMLLTFGLILITIGLFVSDRLRSDLVAFLLLVTLMLTGLVTPDEALAGFSNPALMMVAGLFVVGGAVYQTGLAHATGRWMMRLTGSNETGILVVTMITVAVLSAFMSSVGATAVLIPVVMSIAWEARVNPSRLLLPLAFASLIGGMLTIIGTAPNLIVSDELVSHGMAPFAFFSFTPIGLIVLAIGIAFILIAGRRLLHPRVSEDRQRPRVATLSLDELAEEYRLPDNLFQVRVRRGSSLIGKTLVAADLRAKYHVTVVEIQYWPDREQAPLPAQPVTPQTVVRRNAILHIQGTPEQITHMAHRERLGIQSSKEGRILSHEIGMVELLLPPRSRLLGRTLQDMRFRDRYGLTVLSLRRLGKRLDSDPAATKLRFGDTLLVLGTWKQILELQQSNGDFVIVGQPKELLTARHSTGQAALAAVIILGMLFLLITEILPTVTTVFLAAAVLIVTGCLSVEEAYKAINWQSLMLQAGMLPLAVALQKTGGIDFIAETLTNSLGMWGPVAAMGALFALTSIFSQFISNTATTVLMAPVAYQTAVNLGVSPRTCLMAVAVAASTAFATPISSPNNTLVMTPGGYRFTDYLKVGLLLELIIMVVSLVLLPWFFPL